MWWAPSPPRPTRRRRTEWIAAEHCIRYLAHADEFDGIMDLRGRELRSLWVLLAVLVTAVPARIASAHVTALAGILESPIATGPVITYTGMAAADGTPFGMLGQISGVPVFFSSSASGFQLVVEARTGLSG